MTAPVNTSGLVGAQGIGDLFIPDTVQRFALGEYIDVVDPAFGWGQYIYGKAGAAIALPGRLNHFDYLYASFDVPNSAGVGRPVFVNKAKMLINTFGWFQLAGIAPVQAQASVAIAAQAGITAAGQLGAVAATKALQGCAIVQPSTYAPTKTVSTVNGSPIISMADTSGLFIGLTVSGTGLSGTIIAVDPNGNQVTLSANASATGVVTGTFTHTGFVLALLSNPGVAGTV